MQPYLCFYFYIKQKRKGNSTTTAILLEQEQKLFMYQMHAGNALFNSSKNKHIH